MEENKNKIVEFNLMTYAGSVNQEVDKWTRRSRISGISSLLCSAASGYFFYQVELAFVDYQDATSTQTALNHKNSIENNELYTAITLGLAGVTTIHYLWSKGKKNEAKLKLHYPKSKDRRGNRAKGRRL